LSVGVGLGVLAEMMEEELEEVVGPKGKHDPGRDAVRHGHESGEVTLGGRRVCVQRPRARSVEGETEIELRTYRHFADRDPLQRVVLERMLAGVSARRYERAVEPVGSEVTAKARSTSKSSVSRTFIERTRDALGADEPHAEGRAPGGDDDRRDRAQRAAAAWWRSASPPTA
jgi:putative transposase